MLLNNQQQKFGNIEETTGCYFDFPYFIKAVTILHGYASSTKIIVGAEQLGNRNLPPKKKSPISIDFNSK